jgi:esterase FrsA
MAEKSLDEIKADILHRAGRINPFERVKKEDVEQVVKNIASLDADLWGKEWGKVGLKYEALAEEQDKHGKKKEAGETYYLAYEYYRIGRYPVPSSPQKMTCYKGALRTFIKAGPTMEPPLERIEIPFEGK